MLIITCVYTLAPLAKFDKKKESEGPVSNAAADFTGNVPENLPLSLNVPPCESTEYKEYLVYVGFSFCFP